MTTYIIFAMIVCAVLYFLSIQRADVQNAQTLVYSRFTGVWLVIPETPFDKSVEARAEALREAFHAHGNPHAEVVSYTYGMPIGKNPTAATEWSQFLQVVAVDYIQRVQEYSAKKAQRDQEAAAVYLAGQRANQNFTNDYDRKN